jgi:hypothetical protein
MFVSTRTVIFPSSPGPVTVATPGVPPVPPTCCRVGVSSDTVCREADFGASKPSVERRAFGVLAATVAVFFSGAVDFGSLGVEIDGGDRFLEIFEDMWRLPLCTACSGLDSRTLSPGRM